MNPHLLLPLVGIAAMLLPATPAGAQPREGLDCQYQNILVDASTRIYVPSGYGMTCTDYSSAAIRGTINGIIDTCEKGDVVATPAGTENASGTPVPYYHVHRVNQIVSREGFLFLHEYGAYAGSPATIDKPLQASLMHVTGGDGKFAGASGVLAVTPEWPFDADLRIAGVVCVPRR